jgi:hypothetical protein
VDLVGFLRQAELAAAQVGPDIVDVEPSRRIDVSQAEREINLLLRVWGLVHPSVTLVQVPSAG